MTASKSASTRSGCGLTTLGAVVSAVLLVLKLIGTVSVSWLVVALPVLIGLGASVVLSLILLAFVVIGGGIALAIAKRGEH